MCIGHVLQVDEPVTSLNVPTTHALHTPDADEVPLIDPVKPALHKHDVATLEPEGLAEFDGQPIQVSLV